MSIVDVAIFCVGLTVSLILGHAAGKFTAEREAELKQARRASLTKFMSGAD